MSGPGSSPGGLRARNALRRYVHLPPEDRPVGRSPLLAAAPHARPPTHTLPLDRHMYIPNILNRMTSSMQGARPPLSTRRATN